MLMLILHLHVAWASSQHGGWDQKMSIQRETVWMPAIKCFWHPFDILLMSYPEEFHVTTSKVLCWLEPWSPHPKRRKGNIGTPTNPCPLLSLGRRSIKYVVRCLFRMKNECIDVIIISPMKTSSAMVGHVTQAEPFQIFPSEWQMLKKSSSLFLELLSWRV